MRLWINTVYFLNILIYGLWGSKSVSLSPDLWLLIHFYNSKLPFHREAVDKSKVQPSLHLKRNRSVVSIQSHVMNCMRIRRATLEEEQKIDWVSLLTCSRAIMSVEVMRDKQHDLETITYLEEWFMQHKINIYPVKTYTVFLYSYMYKCECRNEHHLFWIQLNVSFHINIHLIG